MADKRKPSFFRGLFAVVVAILCMVTLVAAGFAVCLIPKTTEILANNTHGNVDSPFSNEQLVEMAIVGRDYTIDAHDRQALIDEMAKINKDAKTRYANASEAALLAADDTYVLTPDAISHLDDVHRVISIAKIVCAIIAIVMVIGLIIVRIASGRRVFGHVMFWSGLLILVALVALAVFAIIDFNGFFSVFHSLFFTAGTWTFSARSLLICMYPLTFWIGMAIVWVVASVICCLIFMIIGRGAIRRARRKRLAAKEAARIEEMRGRSKQEELADQLEAGTASLRDIPSI